jgi:hypothetical protein
MYKSMAMNSRYVLRVGFAEERPVGPNGSNLSREVEKFNDLRPGQILSVRKACDKFLESRGLKQVPFGTYKQSDFGSLCKGGEKTSLSDYSFSTIRTV